MLIVHYILLLIFVCILAIPSIYPQNSSNNTIANISNNYSNIIINNNSNILSYKYEPFLSLNGTMFKDLSHDNKFSLINFSIGTWIRTNYSNQTILVDHAHIVNKGGFNSEIPGKNMNYGIWISKNGIIQGGFETEDGKNYQVSSTKKYNDGKWHYILLSYNGTILRLEIDGNKQVFTLQTESATPDSTGKQPLRIGANSLEKDKFFTGFVDEIRIWNRGLTESDIDQIYNNYSFDSKGQILYLDFKDSNSTNIGR